MRLVDFYAAIGPFLHGGIAHEEAVRRLYPAATGRRAEDVVDARRLAIYGRFCRIHRREAVDGTYSWCREAVTAAGGEAAWDRLVEDYFQAHPMRHVELNENGAALPEFLVAQASSRQLPTWLPALADFEWWEWRTRSAPDEPAPIDAGPLRLASTVELRPYAFDLAPWIDAQERRGAPAAVDNVVLFFRDRALEVARRVARPIELVALKQVAEAIPPQILVDAGVDLATLRRAIAELHEAGALVGIDGASVGV